MKNILIAVISCFPEPWISDIRSYFRLMRFHRPIGTLLLLWPTLWALWIASQGHPNSRVLLVMILGVIVMRAAGCVINDIADREFDGKVARTKDRPLVTGEIKLPAAIILFALLMSCALALVLLLNRFALYLAFVGAMLAMLYPLTKRFFIMPQLVLGIAFNWGVPLAFAAQTNKVSWVAWIVYLIACIWTVAYDTLYAMADRKEDKVIGIYSSAILFGNADRFIIGLLQLIFLSLLVFLGYALMLSAIYYGLLLAVFACLIYQQYLIRERIPTQCFRAFLNNQWIGLIVFVGFVISYI